MSLLHRLFGEPVAIIHAPDLYKTLQSSIKPFVLDVRQPDEFRAGHITGAKLIPLGELSRRMEELPTGQEIVCICATGHRSLPAARKLMAAGHSVRSLKHGMIAWQIAKYPIKKGMSA